MLMLAIWKHLDGYKTHIGVILLGLTGLMKELAWLTPEQAKIAAYVLGAWTGVSLRLALKKSER